MLIVTPQIDWRRDGLPSSSALLGGGAGGEQGRREEGWGGARGGGGSSAWTRKGEERGILLASEFPGKLCLSGL